MLLYESNIPSGNVYKVQLLLAHLQIPYKLTTLDILAQPSETRTPEFLKINLNGRIPVLVLDDGTPLAESNAILYYLAEDTKYLPSEKLGRAQVLQWLLFEQYSLEPYIGVVKFHKYWGELSKLSNSEQMKLQQRGQAAMDVVEGHLQERKWFVGDAFTIADIALYAYTQHAEAVGFQVGQRTKEWLGRIEGLDGHARMKKDPIGKCPL